MARYLALVLFWVATTCLGVAQPMRGNVQIWQGKMAVSAFELTIVLRITTAPDGKLSATIQVPEQNSGEIPCTSVSLDKQSLSFTVDSLKASYTGKLSADGTTADGTFTQGAPYKLILKKVDKAPEGPKRPQTPKPPFPYAVEEVTYRNASANLTLAGTLTKPKTGGPFATVLLITGSGPQDRDESILGHRPFAVLADALTRRGLAVLRVDDRGVGKSTGVFAKANSLDFASDVDAGVAYLKTRKDVDAKRIGLIGHSEGGLIAPIVAARNKDVAYIVLMAGPGVPGRDIIARQAFLISKAGGAPKIQLDLNDRAAKETFDALKDEPDDEKAVAKIVAILEKLQKEAPKSPEDKPEAEMRKLFEAHARTLVTPWMRFFLYYDPRTALRKVKVPVLAVNGELDLQVPPDQSLPEIEKALRQGGNRNFAVKRLPGLNHLFQRAKTGAPVEYARIEQTIDPTALKAFGDWLVKITTKRGGTKTRTQRPHSTGKT